MKMDFVEVNQQNDNFIVRVTENGVSSEKIFTVEGQAYFWADGQSLRLGLPMVKEIFAADQQQEMARDLVPA